MKRPLILISNDDGYKAKGINFLIEVLAPIADILVMAPTNGRSGMGCAITSKDPVYYSLVEEEQGITIFKCTGTPVDCIKLALHEFPERTPDIIIGGVNHGDNSGVNVHYSGTMGIVIEGCMKGIPSIGFSLDNHSPEADFEPLRPYILQVVNQVLEHSLPIGTCLNVNFPATPIYEGIKICRMAQGEWTQEWERHSHPRGGDYYWLVGSFCMRDEHPEDADRTNMTDGYVAITPIQIDMTDYRMIEEMKAEWSWES
ncbi:MAG: 5'/3'-nucleotidase SurE [Bacteroidales bacterium]|nr:5'/3'-nucleotidase SurE [Bacteroidales bacterium]